MFVKEWNGRDQDIWQVNDFTNIYGSNNVLRFFKQYLVCLQNDKNKWPPTLFLINFRKHRNSIFYF